MVFAYVQFNGDQIEWQKHPFELVAEVATRLKRETMFPKCKIATHFVTLGQSCSKKTNLVDSLLRMPPMCPNCHEHRGKDHDSILFRGMSCQTCLSYIACRSGQHQAIHFSLHSGTDSEDFSVR